MTEPLTGAAVNTDRELWRERKGDFYADSVHVTTSGGIGIDCGGYVIVKTLREWHRLAHCDDKATAVPPDALALAAYRATRSTPATPPRCADCGRPLAHSAVCPLAECPHSTPATPPPKTLDAKGDTPVSGPRDSGAGGSAGTLSAEDAELVKKLGYMGRQYSSGQYARGGKPTGEHYLLRAAARIEALARERDEALSIRNDFATRNSELWSRAEQAEARADALGRGAAVSLHRRCRSILNQWNEKYGEFQPEWLPPAHIVPLLEDLTAAIDAALASPAQGANSSPAEGPSATPSKENK